MTPRTPAIRTAAWLAAAALALVAARAEAGTCTVVPGGFVITSHVPSAGDFAFAAAMADVAIPFDVDESAGTVTIARENLADVSVNTQGGPVEVKWMGPTVTGTIDASGTITIPDFAVDTVFAGTIDLNTTQTLSTAPQAVNLGGVDYPTAGAALDFTSGLVTLAGAGLVPVAPIVNEPVLSGLVITCKLDSIPDRTKLKRGAALKSFKGTATATGTDKLSLKAALQAGGTPIDAKTQDVVIRLATPAGDRFVSVLSSVEETKTGRKVKRTRTVSIQIGRPGLSDEDGSPKAAPTGTKLVVRGSKRKATVTLRVPTVDLKDLTGNLVSTVTVGSSSGSLAAVAAGGKITTPH
jgi:hypothetical protein